MRESSFAQRFRLVQTLILEQPDTAPVVRPSGFDILGRPGDGPGEFRAPRCPRFGPDGRVHVADGQAARVAVFDTSGTLLREIRLTQFSPVMGVSRWLGDSGYVLTGAELADVDEGTCSFLADSLGEIRRFVQAVLTFGDPGILVVRFSREGWLGFRDAPAVLLAGVKLRCTVGC